jgi:hypothetical protein
VSLPGRSANANRLLVEGEEDKRVIPYLMEANGIAWGDKGREAVDIQAQGGIEAILDRHVISAELKASGLTALGILIDANDSVSKRWQSLRSAALPSIPDLPEDLPSSGLVHQCSQGGKPGVRFGVWIMPDNRQRGMMETFLGELIPPSLIDLWAWTETVCTEASSRGAPFKNRHADKARLDAQRGARAHPAAG